MARWIFPALIANAALNGFFHQHFSSSAPVSWPTVDAFTTASTQPAFTTFWPRVKQQKVCSLNVVNFNIEPDVNNNDVSNEEKDDRNNIYTTAILKVAYDGTYFRGWTAGNSELKDNDHATTQKKSSKQDDGNDNIAQKPPKIRQSRRSRTLQRKGGSFGYGKNRTVRTVADTIRSTLAKIYGDVHPNQITIESCSRTDAGVHALSLVAQFYCSSDDAIKRNATQSSMPIRPNSHDDTSNFRPLPFDSDITKLVFVLNRMLPPDVRIVAASPLPQVPHSIPTKGGTKPTANGDIAVFHPTLHTMGKTYTYQFAIGPVHDPLLTQYVWHLDGSSNRAVGMNGKKFCLERALLAANLFVDSTDGNVNIDTAQPRDYGAFRSAFRGTDRGRVQSTICKLWRCEILQERKELLPSWETDAPGGSDATNMGSLGLNESLQTFTVVIMGDRFLYKMIRNIVGTIVAVGCGHLELEDVRIALDTGKWGGNQSCEENATKDRGEISVEIMTSSESNDKTHTIRRICAPGRGLTLAEVHYPEDVDFDWQTG